MLRMKLLSRILVFGSIPLVVGSITDKIQGINTYHIHDIMVVVCGVIVAIEVYKYVRNRENTRNS